MTPMKYKLLFIVFMMIRGYVYAQEHPASELSNKIDNEDDRGEGDWDSNKTEINQTLDTVSIEELVEPPVDYHYSAFGRPNPFVKPDQMDGDMVKEVPIAPEDPSIRDQSNNTKSKSKSKSRGAEIPVISPLQRYPLESLQVKGIWLLDGGLKKSLIMTPQREGVIVKVGDPISAGKVMDIHKDHVVVRQYRIRRDGAREYEDSELYLGTYKADERSFVKLKPGMDPEYNSPAVKKRLEEGQDQKISEISEDEKDELEGVSQDELKTLTKEMEK